MQFKLILTGLLITVLISAGCSDNSFPSARGKGTLSNNNFVSDEALLPASEAVEIGDVRRIPPPDFVTIDENGNTVIWGPGLTTAQFARDEFMVEHESAQQSLELLNADANLINCANDTCESSLPLIDQNSVNDPLANMMCGPTSTDMIVKKVARIGYLRQVGLHKSMDNMLDNKDTLIKYIGDKQKLSANGVTSPNLSNFMSEYSNGLGNGFSATLKTQITTSISPEDIAGEIKNNSLGILLYDNYSRNDNSNTFPISTFDLTRNG